MKPLMKSVFCIGLLCSALLSAEEMREPRPFDIPDWFKSSFLDIGMDITEAKAADKQLIIFFHQDGCPYCAKLIEETLSDAEVKAYLLAHFHIIDINIFGSREVTDMDGKVVTEKEYANNLGIHGTPVMRFLDGNGDLKAQLSGFYTAEKLMVALHHLKKRS